MMHVGLCLVRLRLPENGSLKEKRAIIRPIIERVRRRYSIAVAEVDDEDNWQEAAIGLVCVSNDSRHANSVLSQAVAYLEGNTRDAEFLDYKLEFIRAF
jgi:uncharacterized protein YlxP (DUF503 family)